MVGLSYHRVCIGVTNGIGMFRFHFVLDYFDRYNEQLSCLFWRWIECLPGLALSSVPFCSVGHSGFCFCGFCSFCCAWGAVKDLVVVPMNVAFSSNWSYVFTRAEVIMIKFIIVTWEHLLLHICRAFDLSTILLSVGSSSAFIVRLQKAVTLWTVLLWQSSTDLLVFCCKGQEDRFSIAFPYV